MIEDIVQPESPRPPRGRGKAVALVAAGLVGGIVVAGAATATADTGSTWSGSTPSGTQQGTPPTSSADQSQPQRSDEKLLTGTTADKVRAAALAKYPAATVQRVETDSDGVYEAHIVTTDGQWVIVQVGSDFTVTGTQTGGPGGGGRPGNGSDPDPNDDDGPGTGNAPGSSGGSASQSPATG